MQMRSLAALVVAILVAGLAVSPAVLYAQPVPAGMMKSGVLRGTDLYSSILSTVQLGKVTGNVSGATQFASSDFAGKNLSDDLLNTHWKVYVLKGTNVSEGSLLDVTDFVSSTGTFTTSTADGNWAVGDYFLLVFVGPSALTELDAIGSICFPGRVTTGNDDDTLYCESWVGLGNDRFNDGYYCEVTYHPTTAPRREIQDVSDFVSSTGCVVLGTAFSDTVDAGDILTIWHVSAIRSRLPGQLQYEGMASVGALETAADSFYVTELIGFGNDYFNRTGYYAQVVYTTDGGAPLGQCLPIKDYVSNTGLFELGYGSGAMSYSAVITAGDVVSIVHPSLVRGQYGVPAGFVNITVSASSLGTSTKSVIYSRDFYTIPDSVLSTKWFKVLYDASGTHVAPEGERMKITKSNAAAGYIVLASALTTAPAEGDKCLIYNGDDEDVLWGPGGVPAVTAAKLAAGVSVAEGLLYINNSIDSIYTRVERNQRVATTDAMTGTAAADSFTCFTAVGDVYLTGLKFYTTVGAGATSELCNFVLQVGAAGGVIVRMGEGKNLNALAAGVVQYLNPSTAVLTDSLAYVRNSASAANPVVESGTDWRILIPSGSVIKLTMPGSSVATKAYAQAIYTPFDADGKLTSP